MKPLTSTPKNRVPIPKPPRAFFNKYLFFKVMTLIAIIKFFDEISDLVRAMANPLVTFMWRKFVLVLKMIAYVAYFVWATFVPASARYGNVFSESNIWKWVIYAGWRLLPIAWFLSLVVQAASCWIGLDIVDYSMIGMTRHTLYIMPILVYIMVMVPVYLGHMSSEEVDERSKRANSEDRDALWNAATLLFALNEGMGIAEAEASLEVLYVSGLYTPKHPVPVRLEEERLRYADNQYAIASAIDDMRATSRKFWIFWERTYHDNGNYSYKVFGLPDPVMA